MRLCIKSICRWNAKGILYSPYKYATVGLAVALLLVTIPHWAWPLMEALLVDEANMSVRDGWMVPETWSSHHWESSNRTEAVYLADYADCTLQMNKSGTGTSVVSVLSLLECSQEDGVATIVDDLDIRVKLETVPSDFEVTWTDQTSCSMMSEYRERSDRDSGVTLSVFCVD